MADSLRTGKALAAEIIFDSHWNSALKVPERRFAPKQYVEMPFITRPSSIS